LPLRRSQPSDPGSGLPWPHGNAQARGQQATAGRQRELRLACQRRKWLNTIARVHVAGRGTPHRCRSALATPAILDGYVESLAPHTSKAAKWRSRTTRSRLNWSYRSHRPPLTRWRPGGHRALHGRRYGIALVSSGRPVRIVHTRAPMVRRPPSPLRDPVCERGPGPPERCCASMMQMCGNDVQVWRSRLLVMA
jgi:hypothetical protein